MLLFTDEPRTVSGPQWTLRCLLMKASSRGLSWVGCCCFLAVVIALPTVWRPLYTRLLKLVMRQSHSEFSGLVLPVFVLHLLSAGHLWLSYLFEIIFMNCKHNFYDCDFNMSSCDRSCVTKRKDYRKLPLTLYFPSWSSGRGFSDSAGRSAATHTIELPTGLTVTYASPALCKALFPFVRGI